MPDVKPGESRNEYMGRCIPYVMNNEGLTQDQAKGKCEGMYDQSQKKQGKSLKAKVPSEVYGNVVEHAGTGLKLPEEMASRIDEAAKGLPKDFVYQRIAKAPEKFDFEDGERADVSTITTSNPDREGDVILPDGISWDQFNRSVPAFHRYDQLPVGACGWMKAVGNGLRAKTLYYSKPDGWEGDWLADAIVHLQRQAVPGMTAKSIGILPVEVRSATAQEKSMHPTWADKRIISKSKGFEYSVVMIPMNADAEMVAVSKSASEIANWLLRDLSTNDPNPAGVSNFPYCPQCGDKGKVVLAERKIDANQQPTDRGDESNRIIAIEHVRAMTNDKGMYQCMVCGMRFGPDAPDGDEPNDNDADDRQKQLQAALAAPFYMEDQYIAQRRKQVAELAQWAKDETRRQLEAQFWLMSGKV